MHSVTLSDHAVKNSVYFWNLLANVPLLLQIGYRFPKICAPKRSRLALSRQYMQNRDMRVCICNYK
jgi:hypothetical protein